MATHFLDIGFDESISDEDLWKILVERVKAAQQSNDMNGILVHNVDEYTFFTVIIDENIELWYKTMRDDASNITWENFAMHYNTERFQIMKELKWVYEDEETAIFQGWIKGCDYPLNIQVIDKLLFPNIEEDVEYNVEIVCFADELKLYKTEEEFCADHGMMSPKSLIPIGTFSLNEEDESQTSYVWMNGIIKRVERKINSHTDNAYYHLLIESLDAEYDVLVAKALHGWLSGFIYGGVKNYLSHIKETPKTEEEFHELIEKRLMALIPSVPYDCITVDIENSKEMNGINFIQTACYDENKYLVEVGKNKDGQNYLYRLDELDLKSVISLFRDTCLLKKQPDLTNWMDVTEILTENGDK